MPLMLFRSFLALITLLLLLGRPALADIVIEDSLGQQSFATPPKRVVSLNWALTEQVLELGITPVGAATPSAYNTWVAQPLAPEQVANIGTRSEPNLEKIAALKPDVILAGDIQRDLVDALSEIAPVLYLQTFSPNSSAGDKAIEHFRTLATLFDKESVAETKLDSLDQHIAQLKTTLHERFGNQLPEVLPVRFGSDTSVYLYTEYSMSAWVLNQLGLKPAREPAYAPWGVTQRRLETLKDLKQAYVLYMLPFPEEEQLKQSFLWQAMPFVRLNHVNSVVPVWSYGGAMSLKYMAKAYVDSLLELTDS